MTVLIIVEVVLFGVLLSADLLSKHFIMPFLESHGDYVLINKVITFTPQYNDGAGFSMLSGKTTLLIIFTVIGLLAIVAFDVYAHLKLDTKKKSTKFLLVILTMMLAGGLGNLIDRIAYGSVRDFIDYTVVKTLFNRSFAICNVADIWLTVGMFLLIIYIIFFYKDFVAEPQAQNTPDPYQVSVAERLMSNRKDCAVDIAQVTFKSPDDDTVEDEQVKDAEHNNQPSDQDANIGEKQDK